MGVNIIKVSTISIKNSIKMVIISDNLSNNYAFFPKNFSPKISGITITVKSTLTNETTVYHLTDQSGLTDYFCVDATEMLELPDGEYAYKVADGDGEVNSTGLIKKGEWKAPNTQYEINDTIEYLQK